MQKYFGGKLDRLTFGTTLKSDRGFYYSSLPCRKDDGSMGRENMPSKCKLFVIDNADNEHEMEIGQKIVQGRAMEIQVRELLLSWPRFCGLVRGIGVRF